MSQNANRPRVALVYSPLLSRHDAGLIRVDGNHLIHLVGDQELVDEAYTMDKIRYPYPLQGIVPHPERAERILSAYESLAAFGITDQLTLFDPFPLPEAILAQTHTPSYIEKVKTISAQGGCLAEATYVSPGSYETALLAAGGAVQAVKAVLEGQFDTALALIRPPGHHAGKDHAGGFCLFNNVAIAARYCLDHLGCQRVMLIDWDLHHGDGTQEIFWDEQRVLFCSLHQFGEELYPEKGDFHETGHYHNIVNLPLPAKIGDTDYLAVFERIIPPLAQQFQPDIILVSAGQDGHFNDVTHLYTYDPGAGFCLSAQLYAELTRLVAQTATRYCKGRYALFLEGGYGLYNLTSSLINIASTQIGAVAPINEQLPISVQQEMIKLDRADWFSQLQAVHPNL